MAGYLFIEGVKGQSTDAKHKDWIDLTTIQDGRIRPVNFTSSTNSGRTVGAVSQNDITCTKTADVSTPKLIEAVNLGTVYPMVKIDIVQSMGDKGGRSLTHQWELKNVIVTSHSFSAILNDKIAEPPQESISLNFTEGKWIYNKYKKDGGPDGQLFATWKCEEGTT